MTDETILSFIKQQAAGARYVFSVCTGALLCGAAGLLHGRRATTHWSALDVLPYYGATVSPDRVVVDGPLITAAGVTVGLDGALQLAALLRGGAGDSAHHRLRPAPALRRRLARYRARRSSAHGPRQPSGRYRPPPCRRPRLPGGL